MHPIEGVAVSSSQANGCLGDFGFRVASNTLLEIMVCECGVLLVSRLRTMLIRTVRGIDGSYGFR